MRAFLHDHVALLPHVCISSPVILVKKAQQKRKETGDERYYAPFEREKFTFLARVEHAVARPFKILFREPMLLAITIYMSVRICKMFMDDPDGSPRITVCVRVHLPSF
jgi:hypothetical protein